MESQDVHLAVRSALTEASVFYTDMLWSPSQSGYNQPGAAQNTPKEIWINKSDIQTVVAIIQSKLNYKVEETETATLVRNG